MPQTFRFYQGENLRIEWAQAWSTCDSTIIRNLRGWLICYPAPGGDSSERVATVN
jgi:hypothetical protein